MAEREPNVIDSVSALLRGMSAKQAVWFRGQSKFGWALTPKLLRDDPALDLRPARDKKDDRTWERKLNGEFRRRSASLVEPGRSNADIYVLAQHYGVPTRLLDWTTGALTALFFAVADRDHDDGGLFTFDPNYEFQISGTVAFRPLSTREPVLAGVMDCLFDLDQIPFVTSTLPVLPNLDKGRMLQQSTCFTLHLPGKATLPTSSYREFRIPKEAKRTIRDELRFAGVTSSALFPELEYVARDIQEELKLPWPRPT